MADPAVSTEPSSGGGTGGDRASAATATPVVYKFGGSSVADAERIGRVADLVLAEERPVVVVVSALGGVTDRLVRLSEPGLPARERTALVAELRERHLDALEQLCPPGEERERLAADVERVLERLGPPAAGTDTGATAEARDAVVSTGEDLAVLLVSRALRARGRASEPVDARGVVRTDARFGAARPDAEATRRLVAEHLISRCRDGIVPVVQGFVGGTADGRTTTLGRGGSDFTAAILGAALGTDSVHIFTDVDGILSGDPRAVEHPLILPEIGYEEAVELSYFGAKVIHPGAAKHAVSQGIDLHIRNTFRPAGRGTRILAGRRGAAEIAAVAHKPSVVLMKVRSHPSSLPYGFLARVFDVLAREQLPVDLVATSHSSTAFTLDESHGLERVTEELSAFAEVQVIRGLATVTVVGHGLMEEPGTDALVFWAVGRTPVHLISQASDVSLSFVVDEREATALVRRLHLALIELREEEGRRWIE